MDAPNSPTHWDIGLAAWVIQDGNYPDFDVGQTVEFALEFWLPEGVAARASNGKVSANNLGDCLYDTVGEVRAQTDQITVLDIGILVYQQTSSQQPSLPQGPRVAVQLRLEVDPFHYFESLSKTGDVLPLVYSWKILSIFRQTAPFIDTVAEGQKIRIRDPRRLGYEEILKTDAWNDDGGNPQYLLRCDLLPIPPKRESATALPERRHDTRSQGAPTPGLILPLEPPRPVAPSPVPLSLGGRYSR
jgi:hypothetical protein